MCRERQWKYWVNKGLCSIRTSIVELVEHTLTCDNRGDGEAAAKALCLDMHDHDKKH